MKKHRQASQVLIEITQDKTLSGNLTYGRLLKILGGRAFGIAILLFALPSILPFSAIPGVAFIFGLPIMIFALQMMIAMKNPWLPKILAKRPISYEKLVKIIKKTLPFLSKTEKLLKPRWSIFTSPVLLIIHGLLIFVLSLLLMLPIPLSNFVFSFLIIMFSLGLVEKDGLVLAIAVISTIITLSFIYLIIWVSIKGLFGI